MDNEGKRLKLTLMKRIIEENRCNYDSPEDSTNDTDGSLEDYLTNA